MSLSKSTLIYSALGLFAVAPLFCTIAAAAIAEINHCTIDINKPKPCMVGGRDIGGSLANWFFSGIFLVLTVPLAAGIAALYAWISAKNPAPSP